KDMEINSSNYRFFIERDSLRALEKTIRKNKVYRNQCIAWNDARRIEGYKYIDFLNYLLSDVVSGILESLVFFEYILDSFIYDFIAFLIMTKYNLCIRLLSFLIFDLI